MMYLKKIGLSLSLYVSTKWQIHTQNVYYVNYINVMWVNLPVSVKQQISSPFWRLQVTGLSYFGRHDSTGRSRWFDVHLGGGIWEKPAQRATSSCGISQPTERDSWNWGCGKHHGRFYCESSRIYWHFTVYNAQILKNCLLLSRQSDFSLIFNHF